jgi:hypothetical protein
LLNLLKKSGFGAASFESDHLDIVVLVLVVLVVLFIALG